MAIADFFEDVVRAGADPKAAANWTTNEVLAAGEVKVSPEDLAGLISLVDDGTINVKAAREVFAGMGEGRSPRQIVDDKGLGQISDEEEIRLLVKTACQRMPDAFESLREGKEKARGAIIGFIMRESKGRANPTVVNRCIDAHLGK
jgi:aspartyl-tRNA(Asn)/glutamyl-tRNA(Gln) amidotransferase subunit B